MNILLYFLHHIFRIRGISIPPVEWLLPVEQLLVIAEYVFWTSTLVRGTLTKLERTTIGAMVTIDVHARDVVSELVADKINSDEDLAI